MYGGQSTYLPLKINTAGVIPPIFASSIIMFPATIAQFIAVPWLQAVAQTALAGVDWLYSALRRLHPLLLLLLHGGGLQPEDLAENLKKYGGFIPGIRPGKKTAEYIDKVLTRITLGGADLRLGHLRAARRS